MCASPGSATPSSPYAAARTEEEPTSSATIRAIARRGYFGAVAVLIASGLRKELSGSVLFDGVSFKVERRDRLALAGPNGAGKTTLLRALAREISLEGGELAWEKGARVALHDQRPPAQSTRPLRDYVLAGTADLAAVEDELRALERRMAGGDHDDATL